MTKWKGGEGEKENAKPIKTRYVDRQGRLGERANGRRRHGGGWVERGERCAGRPEGQKVLQVEGTARTRPKDRMEPPDASSLLLLQLVVCRLVPLGGH